MRNRIVKNRQTLKELFDNIVATNGKSIVFEIDDALEKLVNMVNKQAEAEGKLLFIGNGASASIASHMAADFWKNAGVRAISFNDSALLTCVSNDYGYKYVFEKPIEMFADSGDILFAISSSGESENILRGVKAARKKNVKVITLSGFNNNNSLSALGDMNFYVPSSSYGHVEVIHHSICHAVLDAALFEKNKCSTEEELI